MPRRSTGKPATDPAKRRLSVDRFTETIDAAGKHLKSVVLYIGSVGLLLTSWWQFRQHSTKLDFPDYAALIALSLPLLATFIFETLPCWRDSQRERKQKELAITGAPKCPEYFRIGPVPMGEPGNPSKVYNRADKAHEQILNWLRKPTAPVLHLTGLSGTGKTSLLNAYIIPILQGEAEHTQVIRVRSFDDPLAALRDEVVRLCDQQSELGGDPREWINHTIDNLARRRPRQRLLLIFDQFEELLLLHGQDDLTDGIVGRVTKLLLFIENEPIPGLTTLLCYRSDHRQSVARLGLQPIQEDRNWRQLYPFSLAAAKEFLTGSGLTIPQERMDRLLLEAARIDETSDHVRPIVLNVLGRILEFMAESPEAWRRSRDLLADYLRRQIDDPALRGVPRQILPAMLSGESTAKPCFVGDLAKPKNDVFVVEGTLTQLGTGGLVRCLSPEERDLSRRVWEISHDFIARLLAVQCTSTTVRLGPRIRPWLAPFVLLLCLVLVLWGIPTWQKMYAIDRLGRLNFGVTGDAESGYAVYTVTINNKPFNHRPDSFVRFLEILQPKWLSLSDWNGLQNVNWLRGLKGLQYLNLSGCSSLQNLDGLKELKGLQYLNLSGCSGLQNVDGLKGLTGLQVIDAGGGSPSEGTLQSLAANSANITFGDIHTIITTQIVYTLVSKPSRTVTATTRPLPPANTNATSIRTNEASPPPQHQRD